MIWWKALRFGHAELQKNHCHDPGPARGTVASQGGDSEIRWTRALAERVQAPGRTGVEEALQMPEKQARADRLKQVRQATLEEMAETFPSAEPR